MPRRNSNPKREKPVEYATKALLEETMERFSDYVDAEPSPLREGGVLLRNTGGAQPSVLPEFVYMSTREDQFLQLSRIDELTTRRSHKPYIQTSDTRVSVVRHGFIGNEIYEWVTKEDYPDSDSPFDQPVIVVPVYEQYDYETNQGVGTASHAYFLGGLLEPSHWYYAASRPQALGGLRCIYTDSPIGIPQVVGIQHVAYQYNHHRTQHGRNLHLPVLVVLHERQHITPTIDRQLSGIVYVREEFPLPVGNPWVALYIAAQIKVGLTFWNRTASPFTFGVKFYVRSGNPPHDRFYSYQVATYMHMGKNFENFNFQYDTGTNECSDLNWAGFAGDLWRFGIKWERFASVSDLLGGVPYLNNISIVVGPAIYFVCGGNLKVGIASPHGYARGFRPAWDAPLG